MDKLINKIRVDALKRIILPIILCLLCMLFFIYLGMDSYKRINAGVRNLLFLEEDELEDYMVHSDVNFVLGCFAEYGDAVPITGEITKAYKYYYIINYRDGDLIAAEIDAENMALFDEICEDSWDYMMGRRNDLDKSYALDGSISKMSYDVEEYYIEFFEEMGWSDEDIAECALPYVLHDDANMEISNVCLSWSIAFILLGICLFLIIIAITQFRLKKDIARLGDFADYRIMEDYKNAFVVNKRVRIGRIFTYNCSGLTARAHLNSEIIWAYRTETGRSNQVMLWDIHGKGHPIKGNKRECYEAIKFYETKFSHIVFELSVNLRDLFHKEREKFLALRYNDAVLQNSSGVLMEASQDWNNYSDNPYENPYPH